MLRYDSQVRIRLAIRKAAEKSGRVTSRLHLWHLELRRQQLLQTRTLNRIHTLQNLADTKSGSGHVDYGREGDVYPLITPPFNFWRGREYYATAKLLQSSPTPLKKGSAPRDVDDYNIDLDH